MKKINIFNRNTNLPSYRRRPVSRGIVENRHTAEARCLSRHCDNSGRDCVADNKYKSLRGGFATLSQTGSRTKSPTQNKILRGTRYCGMTVSILALFITIPAFATDPDPVAKKTVASKYYVDTTKQDIIPIDKVLAVGDGTGENDIYVPSIVTTNAAGTTLTGNSVGLLTYEALDSSGRELVDYDLRDDFVPTTAAVMSEINTRQFNIDSTDESFVYDSSTNRYADGSVVVTTDNVGSVDQRGIATAPVYNNQNQLTNGDWLPTMAAVETKQNKMTCAGWDSDTHTDEHCWLWNMNN